MTVSTMLTLLIVLLLIVKLALHVRTRLCKWFSPFQNDIRKQAEEADTGSVGDATYDHNAQSSFDAIGNKADRAVSIYGYEVHNNQPYCSITTGRIDGKSIGTAS